MFGGSGGEEIYRQLKKSANREPFGRRNATANIPYNLLAVFASLVEDDLRLQSNLLNYFGGAYELAWMENDKFVKADDFTFIIWDIVKSHKDVRLIGLPYRIFKFAQRGGVLFIRVLHIEDGKESRQTLYTVGSVEKPSTAEDVARFGVPKVDSNRVCHLFRVHNEADGRMGRAFIYFENFVTQKFCKFVETESIVELDSIDLSLLKPIIDRLR